MSGHQHRAEAIDPARPVAAPVSFDSAEPSDLRRPARTADHPPAAGHATRSTPAASTLIRRRLMAADAVALASGIAIAFGVQALLKPVPQFVLTGQLLLTLASLPAFMLGAALNHLHRARANARRIEEAFNIVKSTAVGVCWILIVAFAAQFDELSRLWIAAVAVGVSGSLLVERSIARNVFNRLRVQGRLQRRIVIVGTDAHAISLVHTYERNPALGYTVVGFVGEDDIGERGGVEVLGPVDEILTLLAERDAVGVVISLNSVDADLVNVLTRRLTDRGYHVALSSSLRDIDLTRLRPQTLDGRTMIYVEPVVRGGWRRVAKRIFDVTLALAIIIVTLPIQIVAALAVAASSRGPVFFRQTRIGQDGEPFRIVKFRTMFVDAEQRKAELMADNEADGPLFKIKKDPRITRVGRVLRKMSIDELPQLMCVLIGTMSVVGPRPALPSEVDQWDDEVRERLRVPPGLTGLWQVSGRSDSSFETYKRMDLYYVDNWSLVHDIKICVRTVGVVLRGSGAS